MGRIVVSENVSLDGVIQDPAGDEGFARGGWVGLIKDNPQINKLALDDALGSEALLLGRRSYEWFAGRWPSRTGELADRLNRMPKYVVSSTLEHPDWNNSMVLRGEVVEEVSHLLAAPPEADVGKRDLEVVAQHPVCEHPLVDLPHLPGPGDHPAPCSPRRAARGP